VHFNSEKIVLSIIKVVELQTPEPKSIEEGVCGHQVYLHIVLNKRKSSANPYINKHLKTL